MGQRTLTKEKRNKKLLKDYLSGKFTTSELVTKYDISTARIYQIINKRKHNGKGN